MDGGAGRDGPQSWGRGKVKRQGRLQSAAWVVGVEGEKSPYPTCIAGRYQVRSKG